MNAKFTTYLEMIQKTYGFQITYFPDRIELLCGRRLIAKGTIEYIIKIIPNRRASHGSDYTCQTIIRIIAPDQQILELRKGEAPLSSDRDSMKWMMESSPKVFAELQRLDDEYVLYTLYNWYSQRRGQHYNDDLFRKEYFGLEKDSDLMDDVVSRLFSYQKIPSTTNGAKFKAQWNNTYTAQRHKLEKVFRLQEKIERSESRVSPQVNHELPPPSISHFDEIMKRSSSKK